MCVCVYIEAVCVKTFLLLAFRCFDIILQRNTAAFLYFENNIL